MNEPSVVPTATALEHDLSLARNAVGQPLREHTKFDLRALVAEPDAERWEKGCTAILAPGSAGEHVTLWKAVCAVDPSFPRYVPRDLSGRRVWEHIPSPDALRRAIHWATREQPVVQAASTALHPLADPWSQIDLDPRRESELRRWVAMFDAQHPAAPRGLLLFGPPGTGKTLLARTLARASEAEFIATTISDLKAPNIGGTAQRVRDLWQRARKADRAIVFVDECDSIFGSRELVDGDSFNRELVQEFLAQWEGVLDNSRHVWVIGATNRRERIDHAMVSRFGAELAFGLPSAALRRRILTRELTRCLVELGDLREIVAQTNGFSGRDLRTLAEGVARDSYDEVEDRCQPTTADVDRHVAAIRKRGNIGVSKRSTWQNLVIDPATRAQLELICEMLHRSEEMRAHDIDLPRGVLLVGDPGTGKTEIARTLANESGLNFIGSKSTDFVGAYTGWSGQMTRAMFARARAESPAILFIDDIDKIAPRAELLGAAQGFSVEVVRALLEEMDGIDEHEEHVFVVAATSRLGRIDEAVVSRLGDVIVVPRPDVRQRAHLLERRLHGTAADFDLAAGCRSIAERAEGFTGRDLVTLIGKVQRRAVMRLLREQAPAIVYSLADFGAELDTFVRPD